MSAPARTAPAPMTVAEFLAWDDGTDRRYELVDGVVRMMAAPSSAHSTIVGNLAVALGRRLRDPCRVRIEYGLRLDWSDYDCYQIDLAVVCGDVRRGETLPEPVLIVEVSARDALQHDRGRKTPDYRLLPGCRCILIVESERRRVERWARDGARWIVQDHIGETGAVPADRLDVAVDLAEIYAGVEI